MARFLTAVPAPPVWDEPRAVDFFIDALDFEELVSTDGQRLGILVRDAVPLHVWWPMGAHRALPGWLALVRIAVEGVADLYERCNALGVTHPNAPLQRRTWAWRNWGP